MDFHDRVASRIAELGLKKSEVDAKIGRKGSYVSNMLASKAEPTSSTLVALAQALDTTPNDLLGISGRYNVARLDLEEVNQIIEHSARELKQKIAEKSIEKICPAGRSPSTVDVIGWAVASGGVLRSADDINEWFTTYRAPTCLKAPPTALQVGRSSLAAKTLLVDDADSLNKILRAMPKDYASQLTYQQVKVGVDEPSISVERISLDLPKLKVKVDFQYMRLYLRLKTEDGDDVVLNFSEPVKAV